MNDNNPIKTFPAVWKSYILLYKLALTIVEKRLEEYYGEGQGVELRMVWVLMAVQEHTTNQRALAASLGINNNVMVDLLDRMEEKSLVTRTKNPENRREHLLRLTPRGKKVLKWVYDSFDEGAKQAWRPLTLMTLEQINEFAMSIIDGHYQELDET